MRNFIQHTRRGFTLIELSIAIMMGMAIGAMVITLFNQQLTFLKIFRTQNFLTEEAPIISMYVSRLVGKADSFSLHANIEDAKAGAVPTLGPSSVLRLNFRQPDGTIQTTILSFERQGTGNALNYYVIPAVVPDGGLTAPAWSVTKAPRDVSFSVVIGILRMTLTGPNNEQITYSGTMQQ